MRKLTAVILAAGKGTRMKSDVPKVLHKVCGKPILRYVLDAVRAVGSLKIFVVVGHQNQQVRAMLDCDCTAVEQERLLGTADAVRCVEPFLKNEQGSIIILCGDAPLIDKAVIRQLIRRHEKTDAACTVLTAVVDDPLGYGRMIRDTFGNIIAIREERDAKGLEKSVTEINVGVYCVKSQLFWEALKVVQLNPKKKEYYLTDIISVFHGKGLKIESVETPDASQGLGINTKEDLAFVEQIMRQRILNNFMHEGITIQDPQATYIDASVKIGRDTIIRPFTFIEEDVRVGNRCEIGPFCRLRPGTRIADDVCVGNFTEVSRTTIGAHSRMKHFSFLGDAALGELVNMGAGVVTANYDGKNKNKTMISSGAFIGSDAIMIAPIKVGKNAIIGAGSVVTKNQCIPDGGIAVGVPARILGRR